MYGQNETFRIEGFIEGRPMSIWEMRNPIIQSQYANVICDFNFDVNLQKKISEFYKLDTNNLVFHQAVNQWAPNALKNIEKLKSSLRDNGMKCQLATVDRMQRTMLFDGYQQHYKSMLNIPEDQDNAIFPVVFAHNDI